MKRWFIILIVLGLGVEYAVPSTGPNPYYYFDDRPIR
jgi:hypothetical protein